MRWDRKRKQTILPGEDRGTVRGTPGERDYGKTSWEGVGSGEHRTGGTRGGKLAAEGEMVSDVAGGV